MTRPASLQKPEVLELGTRGVSVIAADLAGPEEDLVKLLTGIDTVIAAVDASGFMDQIPLANAAKSAGVKRFIPCFFATVAPSGGILKLRDTVRLSLCQVLPEHYANFPNRKKKF